jgi:hypothetical protein
MKLPLYMVSLMATGLIAIPPASIARGISAGHMSAVQNHHNDRDHDRYRYSGIYFSPPYGPYGVSYYDADYSYTPTPEQIATAQEQVQEYLLAVKKGRKHAATHRYISVETLRPTKKQLEDYARKQLPQRPAEPSQLRCLMVFDTQTKQFVGSGCYVVTSKPLIGDVEKFETVSAEFVGQGTL